MYHISKALDRRLPEMARFLVLARNITILYLVKVLNYISKQCFDKISEVSTMKLKEISTKILSLSIAAKKDIRNDRMCSITQFTLTSVLRQNSTAAGRFLTPLRCPFLHDHDPCHLHFVFALKRLQPWIFACFRWRPLCQHNEEIPWLGGSKKCQRGSKNANQSLG